MSYGFKRIPVVGLLIAGIAGLAAVTVSAPAEAHGRTPSLKGYCNAVFKKSSRAIRLKINHVDYYYSRKNRQWVCRMSYPHFQRGKDFVHRHFHPKDACYWQFRTRKVHYHQGINVASVRSIHCGQSSGTVSRDTGKATRLALCNRSGRQHIYAIYGYWQKPARRGAKGNWASKGWYKIANGSCKTVTVGRGAYNADVYLYAEGGGSRWAGPEAGFCVDRSGGFHFTNADRRNCRGGSLQKVRTYKYRVRPGNNRYNFNP